MYPLNLLHHQQYIAPLFDTQLKGEPYLFDFSSQNPTTLEFDTRNFDQFQKIVFDELEASGHQWGIGKYLEERSSVLRNYPQMIEEGRIYHAGLDVIVPEGLRLHAPIEGRVFHIGKEIEVGSYGGYVVLEHQTNSKPFYSLYGHLNSNHIIKEGDNIEAGQLIGKTGAYSDSGSWFTHTHLQIITQKAYEDGRMFKGYVTSDDLRTIEMLFPSPYSMFRY
ncbi:peptidoglycan DD-metalloendopeptidase family protein [Patescibacteria group bacterium]|nr:peptidoglycan DD-metalloendopeptidase family protein [Patescibacteria group bacterium]MBU1123529.1 peptidoglycan DD-metalloendopeptidase family protein [Patescibacteria group bacterium]MBU1911866.1 peptidoglycan DD-metalloendopeptidase family protein [Patescibacteria group bacterium]